MSNRAGGYSQTLSGEGTTPQKIVEKAQKRARALHTAAVHVQRSVDALSNLVGNLQEEQTRQRQEVDRQRQEMDRQRQEIDELKKSCKFQQDFSE